MSFRTVVVQSACKLTYKDEYLVIRGDEVRTVHLSEIHTLIIESTMVTMTAYLLCELMKNKIKIICCDEWRNPMGEVVPYYGSHDTGGKIMRQTAWTLERKAMLWQQIITQKILNQAKLMAIKDESAAAMIASYAGMVEDGDNTNREGHAAKVYFNRIFSEGFNRNLKSDDNAALNYGYALLLSTFNKEIVSMGYITQIGIHHRNEFNPFNLSSDLMETFRYLVDHIVMTEKGRVFDRDYKHILLNLFKKEVIYNNKSMYLPTAVTQYVHRMIEYLDGGRFPLPNMVNIYEDTSDESSCDV